MDCYQVVGVANIAYGIYRWLCNSFVGCFAKSYAGAFFQIIIDLISMHGIHKRMVQFQKSIKNLFLIYTGTTYTLRNKNCSKHERRTAGSVWETWAILAADGVYCVKLE
jgi:hypothetical protein